MNNKYGPIACILTCGYLGYSKYAPGTIASAVLTGIYILLPSTTTIIHHLCIVLAIGIVGYAAAFIAERAQIFIFAADPKQIVIDEWLGMSIALIGIHQLLPTLVAFVVFRCCDIRKPLIIGWVDRNIKGIHGVMLDDGIAGCVALAAAHLIQSNLPELL